MKVGDYLTTQETLYLIMFGKKLSISFVANKLYRIVKIEEGSYVTRLDDRRKDPTIPIVKPYLKIMVENENGRITRLSSHRNYMGKFEIIEKEIGDEVINFNAFETI
jgi:hypothetical protein